MFDFETTQDHEISKNSMKYLHKVNFISATVLCTLCILQDRWKEPLDDGGNSCEICGYHRTITWSMSDFNDTKVDKKYLTKRPLRRFVRWLLYNFQLKSPWNRYDNIVMSHNGVSYHW